MVVVMQLVYYGGEHEVKKFKKKRKAKKFVDKLNSDCMDMYTHYTIKKEKKC